MRFIPAVSRVRIPLSLLTVEVKVNSFTSFLFAENGLFIIFQGKERHIVSILLSQNSSSILYGNTVSNTIEN